MPATARTTRAASSTQTATRTRTASSKLPKSTNANSHGADEVDALASRMTSTLRLKDTAATSTASRTSRAPVPTSRPTAARSKSAAENIPAMAKDELTASDRGRQAMRIVNSAMQSLDEAVQKGWKASQSKSKPAATIRPRAVNKQEEAAEGELRVDSVGSIAVKCRQALATMRVLKGQAGIKSVDVERAAVNVAGKLVGLEMWALVLDLLGDARPGILDLYEHPPDQPPTPAPRSVSSKGPTRSRLPSSRSTISEANGLSQHYRLLKYPLLADAENAEGSVLNVIASSQLYALSALVRLASPSSLPELSSALVAPGNLLDWIPVMQTRLGSKFYATLAVQTFRAVATSLSSADAPPPDALFSIRAWSLRCFIRADSVNGNDFWDQTMRWAASYLKTIPSGSKAQENEASEHIMAFFTELVNLARGRIDGHDFTNGASFGKMCDWWISLARQTGDLETINAVNAMLASTSTVSTESPSPSKRELTASPTKRRTARDDSDMSVSRIYARVSQAEALVHKLVVEGEDKGVASHLEAVLSDINRLPAVYITPADGLQRLQRETERLRHKCVKLLEKSTESSLPCQSLRPACIAVLEALVKVAETTLSARRRDGVDVEHPAEFYSDLTTGSLDTLLVLARTVLSPAQHVTHGLAYRYLERGHKLITTAESHDPTKYLRCLAAAHQNAAALMYKHNKAEYAVRFAQQAYSTSVTMFEGMGDGNKDEQDTLREQIGRRAEILAGCYLKQGERKLAYKSSCDALSWISKEVAFSLQASLAEHSVHATFEKQTTLSSLIDRITRLAASDLLLPPTEVSLRSQLEARSLPVDVIGGVLEYQVLAMDNMLQKPECLAAVGSLLEELIDLYSPETFPIRRSRVLVRKLEHQYHTMASTSPSLASDILEGFVGDDNGKDSGLLPYVPQYQTLTHVWLAMQSHATSDRANMPAVVQHADEAVRLLRRAFVRNTMSQSEGSASPASGTVGKGARKPRLPQTPKTPRGRRAVSTKTPKTPASQGSKPSGPRKAVGHRASIDNVERLYKHLELLSELLNFLGLPLQRVDLLEILRHLNESRSPCTETCDAMLRTTTELAYENAKLGKTGRASHLYAQAMTWSLHKQCSDPVSDAERIVHLLRYASSLAGHGNLEKSSSLYQEALDMALALDAEDHHSTFARIKARTLLIERAALAASVYASIKDGEDNMPYALNALEQSLRLWNRAMENVARLSPALPIQKSTEDVDDPFADEEPTLKQNSQTITRRSHVALDGLQWRVAEGLFQTLLLLAKCHGQSGSPRAAQLYFEHAIEIADTLRSPIPYGTALALQEELKAMCEDHSREGGLSKAIESLGNLRSAGLVEILRIQGDQYIRQEDRDHAREVYVSADEVLRDLESAYGRAVTTHQTPLKLSRKRSDVIKGDTAVDTLLPVLQAALLRQQVWLLKEPSDSQEFEELLTRLLSLPPTPDLKAEENGLLGRVHLHDACNQFRNDLFLSSLTESIIAVPMGMTSRQALTPSASSTQVIDTLHTAEQYFAEALELMLCKGHIVQTRRISVSLALIHAFQTTLGKVNLKASRLAASLLDMACGISLHRHVLQSIDVKLRQKKLLDDLAWPTMEPSSPVLAKKPRGQQDPDLSGEEDDEDGHDENESNAMYWQAMRDRYQALLSGFGTQGPAQIDVLPANWTVISVNVTEDQSTMLIARHRPHQEPLILCLPLDRQGKREGEDDQFAFQCALDELDDIIQSSNQGISAAKEVAGKEATASWWSERGELDRRLGELLETMEFCWLGAFKTIMCEPPRATKESLKSLRSRLEKIFQGVVGGPDKNSPPSTSVTRLDDNILECFASLTSKCRDEELEDLIYFVLDLYHFHGIPVALAEIDVDMLVMDIRMALEELAANPRLLSTSQADPHLFLVLDKNVQGIPWESMPILRGRSVSRIPSISFLVDRVELSRQRGNLTAYANTSVDRAVVDPRQTFYMLNVSRDLTRTEQQFSLWLKEMDQIGWRGIVGRPPMEGEMLRALESSELVLYFGHGGGEQYVRSQQIRSLPRCAAVMLWGCSSGALRKMGEFDRFGTPHNYMLAGCPNVVATLWDVTDRDIDRFSDSVFKKMRLDRGHVETWSPSKPTTTSIVAAVAQSRDVCKLKYLNGAAPVVWNQSAINLPNSAAQILSL